MATVVSAVVAALVPSAPPAAAATVDKPNACSAAVASNLNQWVTDSISSGADQDWYQFTLSSPGHVIATLGNLPKNYRLDVWSTCGSVLASSTASGTQYEQVYKSLAAGSYRLRVMSQDGSSSSAPYALRFRTVPNEVLPLEHSSWVDSAGMLHVVGEVLNNTSGNVSGVRVRLGFYDSANVVVGGTSGGVALPIVKARGRSPFHVVAARPAGYHRYGIATVATPTTAAPVANLGASARSPYTDSSGRRHYPGAFLNGTYAWIAYPRVTVILYNAAGGVLNVKTAPGPSRVAPRASTAFDAVFADHFNRENRRGYFTSGAVATGCDPAYPTVCIAPPPPDLDCEDIRARDFKVRPADPHFFDGDYDGIGCETYVPPAPPPPSNNCHSSYPTVCIPPPPPDLDCPEISARNFTVVGTDPHGFDGDDDGVGCES